MRDSFYSYGGFGEGQVKEAVLIIGAIFVWQSFRSNAPTTTSNNPSCGSQEVLPEACPVLPSFFGKIVDLLPVVVASDDQIDSMPV
eukprot:CAMPEP_0172687994 /NCGR_PEP_ID=MMETSP1074-20121228/22096_1 /TAXON_ID=2916 /ORGANISM="Ceratium fusus, Strain PA161109" /LENGTH=85 /DNA_ID=CAMNT_0013507541 /DNA_START=60 /DNA_END=317 /DNA_ORIENTATION=-